MTSSWFIIRTVYNRFTKTAVAVSTEGAELTWRLRYIELFWRYVRRIVTGCGQPNGHKDGKNTHFHFYKNRTRVLVFIIIYVFIARPQ